MSIIVLLLLDEGIDVDINNGSLFYNGTGHQVVGVRVVTLLVANYFNLPF